MLPVLLVLFVAVFDRATDELFASVAAAVAAVPPEPETQLRAAIEAFVHMLADDPRLMRIVFAEAGGAGAEVERHLRGTLRRFTGLVAATARPHLAGRVEDELVDVLAMSLVGTLERVIVEWQDGELDVPVERIADLCAELFLTFFAGLRRRPAGRAG